MNLKTHKLKELNELFVSLYFRVAVGTFLLLFMASITFVALYHVYGVLMSSNIPLKGPVEKSSSHFMEPPVDLPLPRAERSSFGGAFGLNGPKTSGSMGHTFEIKHDPRYENSGEYCQGSLCTPNNSSWIDVSRYTTVADVLTIG